VIPDGNILTINFGSFSIKFSLVDYQKSSHLIRGSIRRIGAGEHLLENHAGCGFVKLWTEPSYHCFFQVAILAHDVHANRIMIMMDQANNEIDSELL
jgi:acetate kinase